MHRLLKMVSLWNCGIYMSILTCSVASALILPNKTYLPTYFRDDGIKQIIEGLGLLYESYEVVTEDGYIVNLNRMVNPDLNHTSDKGVPILVVNGLFSHSDGWFLHPEPKLNAPVRWLLEGYDVWLGDQRGSIRSRKHKTLSKWNWRFWDFSFHETGYYDVPAWIDLILEKTGHDKLVFSGLSDGGAFYYVLTSSRPEYQEKLHGGILFAPVAQTPDIESLPFKLREFMKLIYFFFDVVWDLFFGVMFPWTNLIRNVFYQTCKWVPKCVYEFFFLFNDEGCQYAKQEEHCLQLFTAFGGTSMKTVLHNMQLFKNGGVFQQYDYGWLENYEHYGQAHPPVYDISKLKAFTALYFSNIDNYAPNTTVVPFIRKFSGPAYECEIDNVCHTFMLFDDRDGPYVDDTVKVLEKMTRQTDYSDPQLGNKIFHCNVTRNSILP